MLLVLCSNKQEIDQVVGLELLKLLVLCSNKQEVDQVIGLEL